MALTRQEIDSLNEKIRHNANSSIFDAKRLNDNELEHIRQKENRELYRLLAFIISATLLLIIFS